MPNNNVVVGFGFSFPSLLFLLFLTLKLVGVITWSWWWIFAPIWIPTVVVLGLVIMVLIAFLLD